MATLFAHTGENTGGAASCRALLRLFFLSVYGNQNSKNHLDFLGGFLYTNNIDKTQIML